MSETQHEEEQRLIREDVRRVRDAAVQLLHDFTLEMLAAVDSQPKRRR